MSETYIDVPHMLEVLELENLNVIGPEAEFSCPFPGHAHGDSTPSARMNIDTAVFFCHGCKARGSAVDFVARILQISPLKASRMLREAYHEGYIDPDARGTVNEVRRIFQAPLPDPQPVLPDDAIERFAVDWEAVAAASDAPPALAYMLERGFDWQTLDEWQIGYDSHSDRVVIPVHDIGGKLVGFKGRVYDDRRPKYLIIGDREGRPPHYGWPCYKHSELIFGLHRAILMEDPGGEDMPREFVVCEGELNAIACHQAGHAAVAINGSYFTETQGYLLVQEADSVIAFLDSDDAGRNATWGWIDSKGDHHPGLVDRMKPYIAVRVVPEHEGDPASMEESEISALIERAEGATSLQIG